MNGEKKRDVSIYELLGFFAICSANGVGDRICSDGLCCITEWSNWNSACVLNRTREQENEPRIMRECEKYV